MPQDTEPIKNQAAGTSQADSAVLGVAAGVGELEAPVSKSGLTCAEALLACTPGEKQLNVGVIKTDSTEPPVARREVRKLLRESHLH